MKAALSYICTTIGFVNDATSRPNGRRASPVAGAGRAHRICELLGHPPAHSRPTSKDPNISRTPGHFVQPWATGNRTCMDYRRHGAAFARCRPIYRAKSHLGAPISARTCGADFQQFYPAAWGANCCPLARNPNSPNGVAPLYDRPNHSNIAHSANVRTPARWGRRLGDALAARWRFRLGFRRRETIAVMRTVAPAWGRRLVRRKCGYRDRNVPEFVGRNLLGPFRNILINVENGAERGRIHLTGDPHGEEEKMRQQQRTPAVQKPVADTASEFNNPRAGCLGGIPQLHQGRRFPLLIRL